MDDYLLFKVVKVLSDVTTANICYNESKTDSSAWGYRHIIAAELGGSGTKYWTFSQNAWMNEYGPWREFEQEIRGRIDDERDRGLCAAPRIELFYKDEDLRPTKIQYRG